MEKGAARRGPAGPAAGGAALAAHPISILTCEALEHRDRLEMKITLMPEDFLFLYGLYANAQSRIATRDITMILASE